MFLASKRAFSIILKMIHL